MKICEYCGTKAEDDVLQCYSCGSQEFENICNNCGNTFNGGKCPSCGVLAGEKPHICNNCGKKIFEQICPSCGTDLNNEKKNTFVYTYTTEINTNTKHNSNTQSNIDTSKTEKKFARAYKIFVVLVVLILFIGLNANKNKSENLSVNVSNNKKENTNKNTLSDLKILALHSHPKFYGDYEEAERFWQGYKQVAVVNTNQKRNNEDKLLIIATSDKKLISDITINFSYSDEIKHELTVDKVLEIACEYIPYEMLEKYYTFTKSFHETFKGKEKYEAYHYVMSLNKKGKSARKNSDFYLDSKFAIKIIHRNDDDWIVEINYLAYQGNHEKFSAKAYEVEDWEVDLSKYK